jgi:hypothetical protein
MRLLRRRTVSLRDVRRAGGMRSSSSSRGEVSSGMQLDRWLPGRSCFGPCSMPAVYSRARDSDAGRSKMNGVWCRLVGLCLPPLVLCALDGTLTLVGQSADYWSGHYAAVNESSPTFNHLLQLHPMAFAFGLLVWSAIFVAIILLLPETPALIVSIAATFGHTVGAATWLLFRFQYAVPDLQLAVSTFGCAARTRHSTGVAGCSRPALSPHRLESRSPLDARGGPVWRRGVSVPLAAVALGSSPL